MAKGGYRGPGVPKDRYGFILGEKRALIAQFIDAGLANEEIEKRKFLKKDIYAVRTLMKNKIESGAISKDGPANADDGKYDKWGFRLGSKRHEIAVMLEAGKNEIEIKEAIEGSPFNVWKAKQLMRKQGWVDPHGRKSKGDQPLLPAIAQEHAPAPVKRKKNVANGHDGPPPFPMVEVVIHDGRGREIPIFASPDVFPYIYGRVMRKLGMG